VLVVDDEFGVGEVLEAILQDEGYEVTLAVNGQQALQRLAELDVDLVLTDYMMPLMDGPGLIQTMAGDPRLKRIPVVLMSSLPEEQVAERINGYVAFLRKPFRAAAVVRTLAQLLDGTRS
jgi:CheY-like chemotaxis protein